MPVPTKGQPSCSESGWWCIAGLSGKKSKVEGAGEPSGPVTARWRPLWQPGWHPRGAPCLRPVVPGMTSSASEDDDGCSDLDESRVEAWLDEHPTFVGDYFMRKASRKVVDSWLLAHAVPQGVVQEQAGGWFARCSSVAGSSGSLNSTNISSPMRKISACEFDRGSPLRPIVQTSFDGTPTFLTLPPTSECQVRLETKVYLLQPLAARHPVSAFLAYKFC